MAYSTISKPGLHFNTKLYTGNGSTHNITGIGFQPDWVWMKQRNSSNNHRVYDAVRGATKTLYTNLANDEGTNTNELSAFNADGFTLGTNTQSNGSGDTYAAWNWKANGQGSSNTDGSINTTYTSANTTAGFSIATWSGTGSAGTIGHGLGVVPEVAVIKSRTNASDWWGMYHHKLGNNKAVWWNDNSEQATRTYWNNTTPTASVFSVDGSRSVNGSGENLVGYFFAGKKGYSKFGIYTGNGNADGTFVYTGFKPAWILIKRATTGTQNWYLWDSKRLGYNIDNNHLQVNGTDAEGTADTLDILSNGFKIRESGAGTNNGGETYIYMSFAEEPLVANVGQSIPATAR